MNSILLANLDEKLIQYQTMWLILLALIVWVPLLAMSTTFIVIWFKLQQSLRAFPYLSKQSSYARTRRRAIKMLFFLIIMELICRAPWTLYIICDYIIDKYYRPQNLLTNPYPMVS
jgi:hypothetical protein